MGYGFRTGERRRTSGLPGDPHATVKEPQP